MELVGQNRRRLQMPRIAIHLQLAWHLHFVLGLLLVIMVIVLGAVALIQLIKPLPSPFATYADILPGHPEQAALERGFRCFANMFDDSKICARRDEPASPLFSRVHLLTSGDHIHMLSFTTYFNAVTIGDLVLLWGRPDIQLRGRVAALRWLSPNVTAIARLSSGRPFNYFTSVAYIAFTAS